VPHEPKVAGCKVFSRGQRGSLARKTGLLGPLVNGHPSATLCVAALLGQVIGDFSTAPFDDMAMVVIKCLK